ncbi:MAG: RHS repeat-associated core domain-containing protein [Verrucomicrobiota bacterium]
MIDTTKRFLWGVRWVAWSLQVVTAACLQTNSFAAGDDDGFTITIKASAPKVTDPQVFFEETPIPLTNEATPVHVKFDVPYTMTFSGSFTPTNMTDLSADIDADIATCFDIKLERKSPLPDGTTQTSSGGARAGLQVTNDANNGGDQAEYAITFVRPKNDKNNDFGSDGTSSGGGGCSIGCSGGGAGSTSPPMLNPSLGFSSGMGRDSNGDPVGTLRLNHSLSSGVLSRNDFEFYPTSVASEPISNTGGLRQVFGPQGLADIVELIDGSIELRFYEVGAVAGKDGSGLYTVTASPVIVQKLTPATDPISGNGVIYSDTRNGETTTQSFYGDGNASGSVERSVDARGRITEVTTNLAVDPLDSTKWTRVVVTRKLYTVGANEIELSTLQEEYASWGWGEVIERVIHDPNGENRVTAYAYYDNQIADGAAFKKMKHVINSDGSWEKYIYNVEGRLEATRYPWKDSPAHPDSATATNCVAELPSYDDEGEINGSSKRVLGVQVQKRRSFEVLADREDYNGLEIDLYTVEERRYHGDAAAYLSSSTSYLLDYSSPTPPKGPLRRTIEENGSASRSFEENGNYDEATGAFTAAPSGAFTRSIQTEGTAEFVEGVANRTTRTITISDHKGIWRSEKQVFNGGGYETLSITTYEYESGTGRRLMSVTQDGRVISGITYSGITEKVETDARGTQVTYDYDLGGELIQTTKTGVPAGQNHESQAAISTTFTREGLTTTTTTSSGGLSLSSSLTTTEDGRTVSLTDEQGRTTNVVYTSVGRGVTETRPGGVTRVTTRYLDGQLKSISGTGVIPEFHDYSVDNDANFVHTIYVGTGDSTSPRWKKTVTNGLGQLLREVSPGPNGDDVTISYVYNNKGQLVRKSKNGFADSIFEYDSQGRLTRSGMDVNENGFLDLVSADIVEDVVEFYEKDLSNKWWKVIKTIKCLNDTNSTDVHEEQVREKMGVGPEAEVVSIDARGNTLVSVMEIERQSKTSTETTTSNLSNIISVKTTVNGLLVSENSLTVALPVLFRYDGLGRQVQRIDPSTGLPSITSYNSVGQIESQTNGAGNTTTFTYYPNSHANAGMLATQANGENETARYAYDVLGRRIYQWGDAVHPLGYHYNVYGELDELKTYRGSGDWNDTGLPSSFASVTPSLTSWSYDPASGVLMSKTDAASKSVIYTYDNNGLPLTRTWARGVIVTYSHDSAGRVTDINYSDETPDVAHTYRRSGQKVSTSDMAGSRIFTYHDKTGAPATENVAGGLLNGVSLMWPQDSSKRPAGIAVAFAGADITADTYGYDPQGRMDSVASGNQSVAYTFKANSDLLHITTLATGGESKVAGTRVYDAADRLEHVSWVSSSSAVLSSHVYTYDGAGRRERADLSDGSYWVYAYNNKGEVEGSVKRNAAGIAYPSLTEGYSFDHIGNRTAASVDSVGGGSRHTIYAPNDLNQHTTITHPGAFDVTGSADPEAMVKVNSLATQRLGSYFRRELETDNSTQARWESVLVEASLEGVGKGGGDITTQRSGSRFIPKSAEVLEYDEDGNLVGDSRWNYAWDAENRLVTMETAISAVSAGAPRRKLTFNYDSESRRIGKQVYEWTTLGAWQLVINRRFIYNGWNMAAEVEGAEILSINVWGLDLSQNMQGAGGAGGLLWSSSTKQNNISTRFMVFDGNGNVTGLVDANSSTLLARYDYNAFGELVMKGGDTVYETPWLFGTKYYDTESNLIYYGYRYYSPEMGRWVSRDPIEEEGGINLYGVVGNDPVNRVDALGLIDFERKLTRREADSLHCALKWYLRNPIVRIGGVLKGYLWAPIMLSNYIHKGGDKSVPYGLIEKDVGVVNADKDARAAIFKGGADVYNPTPFRVAVSDDAIGTLSGVAIRYKSISASQGVRRMKAEIRDPYDFHPNLSAGERRSNTKNLPFFDAHEQLTTCGWCLGDTIADGWMADLEDFGLAEKFTISVDWYLVDEASYKRPWIPLGY